MPPSVAKSFRAEAQDVFVAGSIFIVVVVLRFDLLDGAGRETRSGLHFSRADLGLLGVHRFAVGIARVDECEVSALLFRHVAVDVHPKNAEEKSVPGYALSGRATVATEAPPGWTKFIGTSPTAARSGFGLSPEVSNAFRG